MGGGEEGGETKQFVFLSGRGAFQSVFERGSRPAHNAVREREPEPRSPTANVTDTDGCAAHGARAGVHRERPRCDKRLHLQFAKLK